jgi:hypothetical protein
MLRHFAALRSVDSSNLFCLLEQKKQKNKRIAHCERYACFRHFTWQSPINNIVFLYCFMADCLSRHLFPLEILTCRSPERFARYRAFPQKKGMTFALVLSALSPQSCAAGLFRPRSYPGSHFVDAG